MRKNSGNGQDVPGSDFGGKVVDPWTMKYTPIEHGSVEKSKLRLSATPGWDRPVLTFLKDWNHASEVWRRVPLA